MRELTAILDEVYVGQERISRAEIYRRAVAADAPPDVIGALDTLPEGEYAQDEVMEAVSVEGTEVPLETEGEPGEGIPANQLSDPDLLRELAEIHRTRHDALRHGSAQALARHDERMTELEREYLRRFPEREVDPQRLRSGARARAGQ